MVPSMSFTRIYCRPPIQYSWGISTYSLGTIMMLWAQQFNICLIAGVLNSLLSYRAGDYLQSIPSWRELGLPIGAGRANSKAREITFALMLIG
eukprot:4170816-Amphidinium_carterae.1